MTSLDELRELGRRIGSAAEPMLEGLDETEAARKALAILAEAELCTWCVPARWGGADAGELASGDEVSVRALATLRSSLAYHSGMLDVMLVMQGLGSYALTRSDELASEVLPRVATGEQVAALALTEPEAGSDLGGVATRAERRGPGWKLSGSKTFISNAGIADFYTLLARTGGEVGDGGKGCLTMFHVPATSPGLGVRRFEVIAPHPIGELTLQDLALDDDHRIGEVGDGLDIALGTLGRFRTSVAAAANGFARRALDESLAHLKEREQFGRPLASFQGLRFDLAEMDARLRGAELLVDEAAAAVDAGGRATAEVARAKLIATENASWGVRPRGPAPGRARCPARRGGRAPVPRGTRPAHLRGHQRGPEAHPGARDPRGGARRLMADFARHVFICVNERDPSDARGCCHSKGGADVAAAFKSKLYDRGLKRIVRPNKAGCLDQCARGVTVVVYPEGVWYGGVGVDDVDEIIDSHVLGGRPVERLRIPPQHLTGRGDAGGRVTPLEPGPEEER